LSTILNGGQGGTVLVSSIENARNTMNIAQSQLVQDLQMEYSQLNAQPMSSLMVRSELDWIDDDFSPFSCL
jgi:hypothetical protein